MTDYNICFWNLENLFDIEESPRRSAKLQRVVGGELKGWTEAVLGRKLSQLGSIISRMNGGAGPDLLGVCEVENRHVLERLRQQLSGLGRDYGIVHADTRDERGIDVAFIYDADLFSAEDVFSHFIVKRTATRDLVQVTLRTADDKRLIVIGNHWPSRSGGRFESEPYRIVAAETLAYFHDRIVQELGKNTAVVAMGDFNDEPFDRSLSDFARCHRHGQNVLNAREPCFLNLMWSIAGAAVGSHYFSNTPNVLDQFLVSRGLLNGQSGFRIDGEPVEVLRFPEMVRDGDYPGPKRFGRGEAMDLSGFSDHFPISLRISG